MASDSTTTTKPVRKKAKYDIADLLANSIQPFDDLAPEDLAVLGKDLDPASGHIMAILSTTGRLMDGNQRLKVLQQMGNTTLAGANVVIDQHANEDNEYDRALMINSRRRHLTGKTRAERARKIMADRGYSQNKTAELLGITSGALSQLFKAYPDDSDRVPAERVGRDGKTYNRDRQPKARAPRMPKGNKPAPSVMLTGNRNTEAAPAAEKHVWGPEGHYWKTVQLAGWAAEEKFPEMGPDDSYGARLSLFKATIRQLVKGFQAMVEEAPDDRRTPEGLQAAADWLTEIADVATAAAAAVAETAATEKRQAAKAARNDRKSYDYTAGGLKKMAEDLR
jgi:hypothetical protein